MKYLIKRTILTFLYYLFRIFPLKSNKIFISNYYGKGYGDIPKYIVNELLSENNKYDIVWVVKDYSYSSNLPEGVRAVKRNTIKCIYDQITAKYWIDNCRKQFYERKRRKQFYIQTWHGCIGYKKCEKAVENKLPKSYILGAKNDSKMADLFISNSEFCTKNYKDNFWYNGEIIKCGCPRNDIIVNNDMKIKKVVKKHYNIDNDTKICLYAPTFRNNGDLSVYNIDFNKLLNSLENKFGNKWKIMIRLHPNISSLSEKLNLSKNIIDVTKYPDMQELLVTADFMITDYSSCIFDYAISCKPGLIYASDLEDYIKERDFIIKIEETPFCITKNNEELIKKITDFNITEYKKNVRIFFDKIGLYEPGNSSKTIADIISKHINERK